MKYSKIFQLIFFLQFYLQPSAFSLGDLCVPPMANVLKVFLENGQTKSFKYDNTTTVQVSALRVSRVVRFNLCKLPWYNLSLSPAPLFASIITINYPGAGVSFKPNKHVLSYTKFLYFLAVYIIKDVVTSLRDKLCLSAEEHFSLVLEHVKSLKRNKLTLLDPQETLARVSALCYMVEMVHQQ